MQVENMKKKNKRLQKRRGEEVTLRGRQRAIGCLRFFRVYFLKRSHIVPQNVSLPTN